MKQMLLTLSFFVGGVVIGILFQALNNKLENMPAFKECIKEVETKCSSLLSYAALLENENAKLNKQCKSKKALEAKDSSDASF